MAGQTVYPVPPGTDVTSGGTAVVGPYAFSVAKTGNATESLTGLSVSLQAGESLTITGTSVNANDITASMVWVEDI